MRIFLLLALAASAALAQAPKDAKDAAKGPPKPAFAMPVKTAPAKAAPAADETHAVGTLRADESVMIRPEIAGRLKEIHFDEGHSVKKGAVLATLDASEAKAQLASATTQANLEQQRLKRAQDLRQKNFISQQALDDQRSSYQRARAAQSEMQAKLNKSEIRAPFPGVAGLRMVSEGAYVAAGTDIARLEKIDQLKLDFRVPEQFVARLRAGQEAAIAVDAWPGAAFPGKIYAVEPAIDEQTRTVLVRARVANPELKLRPGMFARVALRLGVRENALWIPEQAIVPRGQDSFVFRVVDGKAELVKVQTGARKVGEVEIVNGLKAGDAVITEGHQKIGPGMPVMVLPEPKG